MELCLSIVCKVVMYTCFFPMIFSCALPIIYVFDLESIAPWQWKMAISVPLFFIAWLGDWIACERVGNMREELIRRNFWGD